MSDSLIAYIALQAFYLLAQIAAMVRTGARRRRRARDWTAALIVVPNALVLGGAGFEHVTYSTDPGPLDWGVGALLFLAATALRARAQLDLGKSFSTVLEERADLQLVTSGLYAHIRHPLYLADVLQLVASPTFLACGWTWLLTLLGVAGILVRIRFEEAFLKEHLDEYEAYAARTHALIPGLY